MYAAKQRIVLVLRKMDKKIKSSQAQHDVSYEDFYFYLLFKIEKLPHRGNFFLLYFHLKPPVQYS